MNKKKGYVLIGLLLFFTVLGLSGTVSVLEQDTRLKRFSEDDLRMNLGAIRRGIDLYRFKHGTGATPLETALNSGNIDMVITELTRSSFIRTGVASGTVPWRHNPRSWRIVKNMIVNPSFETDDGSLPVNEINGWRGNFTANDGVPDCWNLTAGGAEQHIRINETGTLVISFWARTTTPTSRARLKIWRILPVAEALAATDITADSPEWHRYFSSFQITSVPAVIRLELAEAGSNSGDTGYIDGLMLEKWLPPSGAPATISPAPSAWTQDFTVTPNATETAVQHRLFREMLPASASVEDFSWWFQW
jgi:hypothetical protein